MDHLAKLRRQAADCRACPLWKGATQTVFGEGPADAKIVFVGEQPGDREDRAGRPFIGPSGLLFDRALNDAGLDRKSAYVTNAVKHFKFELRGKRRLHKRPNAGEISVCRRWLLGEIEAIAPRLVVALGASAAQGLAQRPITIASHRGSVFELAPGLRMFLTMHPSALLRMREQAQREAAYQQLVSDLSAAHRLIG